MVPWKRENKLWGTTLSCLVFITTIVPSSSTTLYKVPSPNILVEALNQSSKSKLISPFKEHKFVSFRLRWNPGDVLLRRRRPRLHHQCTCLRNKLWRFCWRHSSKATMRPDPTTIATMAPVKSFLDFLCVVTEVELEEGDGAGARMKGIW